MTAPHVCLSCRTKLLLPRIRHSRLISYTSADRTTALLHDGPEAQKYGAGGRRAVNASENTATRGRYSGKELRPEQLLDILDKPWQARVAGREGDAQSPRIRFRQERQPDDRNPRTSPRDDRNARTSLRHRNGAPSPVGRPRQKPLLPELEEKAALMSNCVSIDDLPRAWDALQALAHACSRVPDEQISILLNRDDVGKTIRSLEWAAVQQWLDGLSGAPVSRTLPSPSRFLATLRLLRFPKLSFYRPPLWQAVSGVYELKLHQNQLLSALKELTNMWRLCMAARLAPELAPDSQSGHGRIRSNVSPDDDADWAFLPSTTIFTSMPVDKRTHSMFQDMFSMLVPEPASLGTLISQRTHPRSFDYASPALLTLDMIRQVQAAGAGDAPQILPFARMLEALLKIAPAPTMPYSLQSKLASVEDPELLKRYNASCHQLGIHEVSAIQEAPRAIREAPTTMADVNTTAMESDLEKSNGAETEKVELAEVESNLKDEISAQSSPIERLSLMCRARLGRAVEQQNMSNIDKIKREIYTYAGSHANDRTALPLELYEALMRAYTSLRNSKAAMEVWSHIQQLGYKPTTKTYTVMMRGALSVRDLSGMEAFWRSMRQNGLQPDDHAWSVRVFGLLKQHKSLQQGLQALNDMGREWFTAAKAHAIPKNTGGQKKQAAPQPPSATDIIRQYSGSVNGIPRPNLVVMNSAISALASSSDKEIPKVLSWGRSFGIEPDLTTYNALLNTAMRHGQADEALKILQRMHARGVQADSVTWTVLLTALFEGGFLEKLSPAQQKEKILSLIDALHNQELGMGGIDDKGYALIIDRLLKKYSNPTAASAVLSHMIKSGREPTAHIYTILMTSYFQRQGQPDFPAIEVLWKQIQARNNGWGAPVDSVFYDRMIEGYATYHREVGMQHALNYLRLARKAGHKPGWKALESVARALAQRGDWPRLKALVQDVRSSLRDSKSMTVHLGQRDFWNFILETGLLRDEGITSLEQLRPAEARPSPLMSVEGA